MNHVRDPANGACIGDTRLLRIGMVAGKRYLPEEMNAFVSDASIRKAGKGDVVVIGGIFAGRQKLNDRESAPVIQGGFVVSLE